MCDCPFIWAGGDVDVTLWVPGLSSVLVLWSLSRKPVKLSEEVAFSQEGKGSWVWPADQKDAEAQTVTDPS